MTYAEALAAAINRCDEPTLRIKRSRSACLKWETTRQYEVSSTRLRWALLVAELRPPSNPADVVNALAVFTAPRPHVKPPALECH